MSEHQNVIQTLLSFISVRFPIIGLGLSYFVMIIAALFPSINANIWDLEIPKIVMQSIQIILGIGGFLIGYFTFRRNKKNKK